MRDRLVRNWRFWLGLAVSLFFLWWAVKQANDFQRVLGSLRGANYYYLIPALVVYFVGVWLRAERWRYLLRRLKPVATSRLFPVVVVGYMANDVLPARMGELVRVHVLAEREGISRTSSFATVLIERAFDGVAVLIFMAIISIFVPFAPNLQQIFRWAGALFASAIVLFFLLGLVSGPFLAVTRLLSRVLPARRRVGAVEMVASFVDGMKVMLHGRSLVAVLGLSIAAWLCESAMYFVLGLGFGLNLPVYVCVLNTAVVNLGTMVPSSPGYVGTFEALSMFTLGLFGAEPNSALAYTGVLHVALLVPVTLLGFFYMWRHHLTLRSLRAAAQPTTDSSESSLKVTAS